MICLDNAKQNLPCDEPTYLVPQVELHPAGRSSPDKCVVQWNGGTSRIKVQTFSFKQGPKPSRTDTHICKTTTQDAIGMEREEAGWRTVANVKKTNPATKTYWAEKCKKIPALAPYVKLNMGSTTDYFRPLPGVSYCEM